MASRNAASATSRDTNRALERISAAVRSLSFALSCSWSLNRPSFAAQGQKCFRDSYGKPQCGEKPPCDKPGYEPCLGEDFCCRASTLLTLNGLSHSTFLHFQQRGRSALATLTGSQRAVILNSRKAVTVTMMIKTVVTMIRRSWHGDRAPRRLYSPRSLQIPTVVDPILLRRPLFRSLSIYSLPFLLASVHSPSIFEGGSVFLPLVGLPFATFVRLLVTLILHFVTFLTPDSAYRFDAIMLLHDTDTS